jgi:hypothetical protein
MNSIRDRLRIPAGTGWRPEPGDVLIGTVVRITTGTSSYGDNGSYPIIGVQTENGEVVNAHAFHAVLRSELARTRPEVDDTIGIAYDGKPKDRNYEMYRVECDKPSTKSSTPDWDVLAAEADAELEREYSDAEEF